MEVILDELTGWFQDTVLECGPSDGFPQRRTLQRAFLFLPNDPRIGALRA